MKTLIALSLFLVATGCTKSKNLSSMYEDLLFQKEISEANIKIEKEHNDGVWTSKKISFIDPNLKLLQIEQAIIENEKLAMTNFNARNIEIQEMYSTQATPYSGSVTNESSCLENINLNPKITANDVQISYVYQLKSTDRFVFGVCVEEQNVYNAQLINIWCKKSKKFYSISFFYNKSGPTKINDIVRCL